MIFRKQEAYRKTYQEEERVKLEKEQIIQEKEDLRKKK